MKYIDEAWGLYGVVSINRPVTELILGDTAHELRKATSDSFYTKIYSIVSFDRHLFLRLYTDMSPKKI